MRLNAKPRIFAYYGLIQEYNEYLKKQDEKTFGKFTEPVGDLKYLVRDVLRAEKDFGIKVQPEVAKYKIPRNKKHKLIIWDRNNRKSLDYNAFAKAALNGKVDSESKPMYIKRDGVRMRLVPKIFALKMVLRSYMHHQTCSKKGCKRCQKPDRELKNLRELVEQAKKDFGGIPVVSFGNIYDHYTHSKAFLYDELSMEWYDYDDLKALKNGEVVYPYKKVEVRGQEIDHPSSFKIEPDDEEEEHEDWED